MSTGDINWISDALHNIIGLSDDTTVRFLISLSKDANSKQELESNLQSSDMLPAGEASTQLIEKLFDKFGKRAP